MMMEALLTWTPKNYYDHMLAGGDNVLEAVEVQRPDGSTRWMAACSCRPKLRNAILLVDCRHIDNAIVDQDWACDSCWVTWIRKSGSPVNIMRDLELQLNDEIDDSSEFTFGEVTHARRLSTPRTVRELKDFVEVSGDLKNKRAQRALAYELKENGFVLKHVRSKRFSKSQWIAMHGGPQELIDRFKGQPSDYV